MVFDGLTTVNVELTSRCNKECWMCGRRKVDRDFPEIALSYGDMDFGLVEKIAVQLPDNIVVQFHNNGEPLLYPRFADAVDLFKRQIRCTNTNGKLLVEKASEIIGHLDTITISTFENDPEADEQYALLKEFLRLKGDVKPFVVVRCLGDVDSARYDALGCLIARRILHSPMGSFQYAKQPTIPEAGICLDLLGHMAIRFDGKVSVCVRFDPDGLGILGNANTESLSDLWNGEKRQDRIRKHVAGKRGDVQLCAQCEFWGVPRG